MNKIAILVLSLAVLALTVGCTAEAIKDLETTNKMFSESDNSQKIYDSIQTGMTKQEVLSVAGKPLRTQEMESYGMTLEYWYYEGMVQVSFMNGQVMGKSNY